METDESDARADKNRKRVVREDPKHSSDGRRRRLTFGKQSSNALFEIAPRQPHGEDGFLVIGSHVHLAPMRMGNLAYDI